ncbi:hypothetical protein NPX13_g9537 [Xylaria arbuscula]|uniref:Uncharacterized protein n=1 Tax=Xylaria arbuscula TaxID=114810 RepID=A0A9W8N677_9PEZI|nr:hypothetical protein NPX13_g9537 [Xylaria arbuscula]
MRDVQAHRSYDGWKTMQRRGRQRIEKAFKDPIARAKLLAEIPSPRPVLLQPQHNEYQQAVGCLPPYCAPATTKFYPSTEAIHRFSFLGSFPAEIRNIIYQYAIDYPTCRQLSDAYYKQVESFEARNGDSPTGSFAISHFTPTVLLLCKQVTRESLSLLRLRPFVIDRIPPWVMGHPRPLPLTYLISKHTLQNLRFVEIKLSFGDTERYSSGRVWFWVLEDILRAWSGKNSLIRLRIMVKVNNIDVDAVWDIELRNYKELMKMVIAPPSPPPPTNYFPSYHAGR